MKRFCLALTLGVVVLTGVFQTRAQESTRKFVPVTDAMLEKPDPANWLMWRRTQDSWGYSPLNQINKNNVVQLRMVWTRGMAAGTSQESTPLAYDGVMYLPNSGDYIQALDARTGDLGLPAKTRRRSAPRTESEHRDLRQSDYRYEHR
jgi:alcohol dehydrogenase (cytochrome c)